MARSRLKRELVTARDQILKSKNIKMLNSADFFSLTDATLVYASLGTLDGGANRSEIISKTWLSESLCLKILEQLQSRNFFTYKDGSYFPTSRHLLFSEIRAGGTFRSFYVRRLKEVENRILIHLNSESAESADG